MPRDTAGNYALPAGNPVASGTVISTSWANPTMDDLATEITNSLDRNGRGGMLVAFKNIDGTEIAPGITFTNEPSSGLYRAGINDVRMSIGGNDHTRFDVVGLTAVVGNVETVAGRMIVPNDQFFGSKEVGGTLRDLVRISPTDVATLGNANLETIIAGTVVTVPNTTTFTNKVNIGTIQITPATQADELVLAGVGNRGMSIQSASGSAGRINFDDEIATAQGIILYAHGTDSFAFYTAGVVGLTIANNQDVEVPNGSFSIIGTITSLFRVTSDQTSVSMIMEADSGADQTVFTTNQFGLFLSPSGAGVGNDFQFLGTDMIISAGSLTIHNAGIGLVVDNTTAAGFDNVCIQCEANFNTTNSHADIIIANTSSLPLLRMRASAISGNRVDMLLAAFGTGGIADVMTLTGDGNVLLNPLSALYFDGGGDTFIHESGANELSLTAGNGAGRVNTVGELRTIWSGSGSTIQSEATNEAYTGNGILSDAYRSETSGYFLFQGRSDANGSVENEFIVNGAGNMASVTTSVIGADYAEYFEWEDGNPSNEDRVGLAVVLIGDLVRLAAANEIPIGVVSALPAVAGGNRWNSWKGKYQLDDYGRKLQESYSVEGKTHDDNGVKFERPLLNPAFDQSKQYIPYADRKEKEAIGLVGKLRVRKGQPVAPGWVKMRDVTSTVEEWLLK